MPKKFNFDAYTASGGPGTLSEKKKTPAPPFKWTRRSILGFLFLYSTLMLLAIVSHFITDNGGFHNSYHAARLLYHGATVKAPWTRLPYFRISFRHNKSVGKTLAACIDDIETLSQAKGACIILQDCHVNDHDLDILKGVTGWFSMECYQTVLSDDAVRSLKNVKNFNGIRFEEDCTVSKQAVRDLWISRGWPVRSED